MPNGSPTVLVIAGSDSSGGAGIARDLQTLHDLNARGVAVVTAVTAQTNASVRSIHAVPPEIIRDQIETALSSNPIGAIKIGMLGTRGAVEAVASSLAGHGGLPLVLDPVLVASSGRALADDMRRSRWSICCSHALRSSRRTPSKRQRCSANGSCPIRPRWSLERKHCSTWARARCC